MPPQFSTACGFIACCCGRYCCRCKSCCGCCGPNRGAGCCGGRYPTKKGEGLCGCCGFIAKDGDFAYSTGAVWCNRIFMWIYCFFLVLFMSMGQFNGNEGFTTAMKAWAESPQAAVDIVDDMVDPLSNFVTDMSSGPLVDFFADFGATLEPVDLDAMVDAIDCIIFELENPPTDSLDAIIVFVDDMRLTFDEIVNATKDVTVALVELEYQMGNISAAAEALRDHIDRVIVDVDTMSAELSVAIDNVRSSIAALDNFISELTNPTDGTGAIRDDLDAISTAPSPSDVVPVTGSGTFTLHTIVDNNGEDGTSLASKLAAILAQYEGLPNYDTTADNMDLFNYRVGNATTPYDDNLFTNLTSAILSVQPAMDTLDGTAVALNETVKALLRNVSALDLSPTSSGLSAISDILNSISFQPLIDATGDIANVGAVIPCMQSLSRELDALNTSFMEMPESVNQIKGMDKVINESVVSAREAQQNVIDTEADFQTEVENANMTGKVTDINNAQVDIDNSVGDLDVNSLLDPLTDVENIEIDTNVTNDINQLLDTLVDPANKLDNGTISSLRNFEESKIDLIDALQDVVDDVNEYVDDGNTRQCVGTSDACTSDADCGAGRCTVDEPRYDTLVLLLDNLADNVPDVSSAVTALDNVAADVDVDTDELDAELADAQGDTDSVDSSELKSGIDDVLSSLDTFSIEDAFWGIGNLTESLDEADQQLVDQREEVVTLKEDLGDQSDDIDMLQQARDLMGMLEYLFGEFIPDDINARLEQSRLAAIGADQGVGPLLREVTSALDDVMAVFFDGAELLFANTTAPNLTDSMTDVFEMLELVDDPTYRENGPLYFLQRAAGGDDSTLVSPSAGAGGRIWTDADGNEWPDDKECWTRECVNNYIDFANSQPLEMVIKQSADADAPIPLSRVNAMGIPYLLPLLAMLLGFTASVCFCSGYCGSCCSRLSCCCIGLQMPCLFGFMGIYFVMVIFLGDFCYGVENTAYRIVEGSSADVSVCDSAGGTVDAEGTCVVEMSLSVMNLTMPLDLKDTVAGLLGGHCSNDPFEPIWVGAGESMADAFPTMVDEMVVEMMREMGARQPVIDSLTTFAEGAGLNAETMVLGIGDALSCEALNSLWMSVKNALCCETLNALYWATASWYLIAFTYLLCGCTASVMGIKRFRKKLWGKHYEEAKIKLASSAGDYTGATAGIEMPPADGWQEPDPYAQAGQPAQPYGQGQQVAEWR